MRCLARPSVHRGHRGRPGLSGLAAAAILAATVAACGSAGATPSAAADAPTPAASAVTSPASPLSAPSASVAPSRSPGPSGSGSASGSPSASASPASRCLSIGVSHTDPVLEAYLPCTIGGVDLERLSLPLSQYIGSSSGGDRSLYAPWLVGFGLTPEEVNMAVVADLTLQENFVIHAIKVPGVDDAKLASSFGDQAKKAGWPVTPKKVTGTSLLEITDPAAKAAGTLSVGYVFASNHILYTIITDDPALLVEALIKLA
jgi:hypothetical protein